MYFTKTRIVKSPEQAKGDAGIDFFVPDDFPMTMLDPGESILIPSGIKVVVPKGEVLIAFNKSGVITKKQLMVGACVIDSTYRGEVHLHLINTNRYKVINLYPGDKIIQFVLLTHSSGIEEIGNKYYEEKFNNTDRGSGGFGSTDKPK